MRFILTALLHSDLSRVRSSQARCGEWLPRWTGVWRRSPCGFSTFLPARHTQAASLSLYGGSVSFHKRPLLTETPLFGFANLNQVYVLITIHSY